MKGHVRKRGDKWCFVVELPRDEITGKRRQKWFSGFNTKKEAEKALTQKLHELNTGSFVEPNKVTFLEHFESWLLDKKAQVRESTWRTYDWIARCHIIPTIGKLELTKIKPATLQKLYQQLQHRDEPLSARSIIQVHLLIKQCLDRALKWGMIPNNPANAVDPPRYRKKEMLVWNVEEIGRFLSAAESHRLYALFYLAITTGMRKGELLGLRWTDIDFENKTIHVSQALAAVSKGYKLQEPKTASGRRMISLSENDMTVLSQHKRKQAAEKLRVGEHYHDHGLVFASLVGTPISPRNVDRIWYELRKKADVPPITFHGLRHTHATLLLKQGVHPKIVSERLGHSNIGITLDTYSHVLPGLQEAAASQFSEVISRSVQVHKNVL